MTAIGWFIVALVLVIFLVLVCRRAPSSSGAMGYTQEFGYCPNMGACDGCDICEED